MPATNLQRLPQDGWFHSCELPDGRLIGRLKNPRRTEVL